MVERLITWSARNPFLIGLFTLLLVAGGVIAMLRTPLDALPDLSDVQVIVYTEVPGQALPPRHPDRPRRLLPLAVAVRSLDGPAPAGQRNMA